jgi:hypothetical protein
VGEFEYDVVVLEKRKGEPALCKPAALYPHFAGMLLDQVFRRHDDPADDVILVTDTLPVKKQRKAVERENGSVTYRSKNPTPAMALCGAFSLNRSGSPRRRTPNVPVHGFGCQKLTSSRFSCWDRYECQSGSVTAT